MKYQNLKCLAIYVRLPEYCNDIIYVYDAGFILIINLWSIIFWYFLMLLYFLSWFDASAQSWLITFLFDWVLLWYWPEFLTRDCIYSPIYYARSLSLTLIFPYSTFSNLSVSRELYLERGIMRIYLPWMQFLFDFV